MILEKCQLIITTNTTGSIQGSIESGQMKSRPISPQGTVAFWKGNPRKFQGNLGW